MGNSFVSGSQEISAALVERVSNGACQLSMVFKNTEGGHEHCYGQGGLIQGEKLAGTPSAADTNKPMKRRKTTKRVSFSEYASFESTPVTAKHNLESCGGKEYLRTTVKFADGYEADIAMPDGGCILENEDDIEVRAKTAESSALTWLAQDVSFGTKLENKAVSLAKKPRLFEKVPAGFGLRVGHKIGIAVFRTFDITHEDASAPNNVVLEDFYGQKLQACIYTGEVKETNVESQTFCHDINAFEGCSGAVVFLLDKNQEVELDDKFHGMAVFMLVGWIWPTTLHSCCEL